MKLGKLALTICALSCTSILNAQTLTPGQKEDAEAERIKILRASDQIEIIQANSDKIQVEIANLKEQIAKLQETNTSQQQQIETLRTALQKSEEARAKERDVLLAKVGEMIATSTPKSAPAPVREPKKDPEPAKDKDTNAGTSTTANHDNEKGYYHTVEKGQTLSMIAAAYTEKGVKVTVDDIRKANNIGAKDVLKVGQKLFIPKK